jgi:predicted aldo/keto reductase-like oxidoreductase
MSKKSDISDKKMNRRTALKIMGGTVLGLAGITYGFTRRKDVLNFLNHDEKAAQAGDVALQVDRRPYGPDGTAFPLLGFGCMRLPTHMIGGSKSIDEEVAAKMIDYAYRRGANYFDTAYIYHGGQSEVFLGKALKKYPRDSFYLADKMPTWAVSDLDGAKRIFQEQLDRCQVEYFDNYLLHSLGSREEFDRVYLQQGVLDYLRQEKARGRIRKLGFSFHGDVPLFRYLVAEYPWDFTMIQLNYLDWNGPDEEPSEGEHTKITGTLYRALEEKKIPCFVMEPVKGGHLAELSEPAAKLLHDAEPNRSTASWALRFVATHPDVVTVLSGMSTLDQVVDNINTMSDFKPLSQADESLVFKARDVFLHKQQIACTSCRYCMPCPYGVDIPGNFEVYNKWAAELGVADASARKTAAEKDRTAFLRHYRNSVEKSGRADHCIACGKCLSLCPQHLPIPDLLHSIDAMVQDLQSGTRGGLV